MVTEDLKFLGIRETKSKRKKLVQGTTVERKTEEKRNARF